MMMMNATVQPEPPPYEPHPHHRNGGEDGLRTQHIARLSSGRSSEKVWDCPLVRIRASHGVVALAAGRDGLFQHRAQRARPSRMEDADPVVYGDFFSCGWLAASIYASSYSNAGTLAVFREERAPRERVVHRVFETAVSDQALFDPVRRTQEIRFDRPDSKRDGTDSQPVERVTPAESPSASDDDGNAVVFDRRQPPPQADLSTTGLSWAGQDRVCQVTGQDVRVAVYSPRGRYFANRFRSGPSLRLGEGQSAVAGDVAPFGVVVETETDLLVLADEGVWSLGYEPARWRSYSRATNYPNQLHVVSDGRLEIFSFITDALRELRTRRVPLGRSGNRR